MFTIAILGILILLFLATIEPELTTINTITNKQLNKIVKIQGQIINIKTINNNFQIISIKDNTGKIDITVNKQLNLDKNQTIIVTGQVKEYKQYLQIQASQIKERGLIRKTSYL